MQYDFTVQPKAGRSREYILLGKVSRLHPPSSLGLDGEGKPLPHHSDQLEVHKEPSSTYAPIGILGSFMKVNRSI